MAYVALYRKWRPQVFADMIGQEHIVKTLRNSVMKERIAHAYLLCGTRGTGKTSAAKIFARAINCLDPVDGDPCNVCEVCQGSLSGSLTDIIEIDAASNNSVDNVRQIRDEVVYLPAKAKYKVYIIDEVHMLSTGAFNALLKTLEEPPSHVVFLLATTEPYKLPATILSRCQRFDFKRIGIEEISALLRKVSDEAGIKIENDSLRLIGKAADGAMRDAFSLLDQCMATGQTSISFEEVVNSLGLVRDELIAELAESIYLKDVKKGIEIVDKMVMSGKDVSRFVSETVMYFRDILMCKVTGSDIDIDLLNASPSSLDGIRLLSGKFDKGSLISIIQELSQLENDMKWSPHPRILLEMCLIKLCSNSVSFDNSEIYERLARLEEQISKGVPVYKGNEGVGTGTARIGANAGNDGTRGDSVKNAGKAPGKEEKEETVDLGKLKYISEWEQVLKDLMGSGKVMLYTYLLGTRAVWVNENMAGIILDEALSDNKKVIMELENMKLLQDKLKSFIGRQVRIKCIDTSELGEISKTQQAEDPGIEKARDLAEKFQVPFKVIEE